jgi:hypothetical protein
MPSHDKRFSTRRGRRRTACVSSITAGGYSIAVEEITLELPDAASWRNWLSVNHAEDLIV